MGTEERAALEREREGRWLAEDQLLAAHAAVDEAANKQAEEAFAQLEAERHRSKAAVTMVETTRAEANVAAESIRRLELEEKEFAERHANTQAALETAERDAASAAALSRLEEVRAKTAEQAASAATFGARAVKKDGERAERAERAAMQAVVASRAELEMQRRRAEAAAEAAEDPIGLRSMMVKLIWAATTPEGASQVVNLLTSPSLPLEPTSCSD